MNQLYYGRITSHEARRKRTEEKEKKERKMQTIERIFIHG